MEVNGKVIVDLHSGLDLIAVRKAIDAETSSSVGEGSEMERDAGVGGK